MDPTAVTFFGLSISTVSGILTWDDCLKEKIAWDTIVWFSALIMMADFLNKLGVIGYLTLYIEYFMRSLGLNWLYTRVMLTLIYLYLHHFLASTTAHIVAMFATFYSAGISTYSTPPMLYTIILAVAGNLMMCNALRYRNSTCNF